MSIIQLTSNSYIRTMQYLSSSSHQRRSSRKHRSLAYYHSEVQNLQINHSEAKMASHKQSYRAGEAKGKTEEKTNQMMESVGEKAQAAKDKAYQAAQTAKEKTKGATQATTNKTQEKAGVAKDKAWESKETTEDKASDAAQRAGDSAEAGKERTEGFLQQTGDQIKNMAQGAVDTMKGAVGMAKDDEKDEPIYYNRDRN